MEGGGGGRGGWFTHPRMRLSSLKRPTTPVTYARRRVSVAPDVSVSAFAPGLWTHPELCTPGVGLRCLPATCESGTTPSRTAPKAVSIAPGRDNGPKLVGGARGGDPAHPGRGRDPSTSRTER